MHHFSGKAGRRHARAAIVAIGGLTLAGIGSTAHALPTRSTSIALTNNGTTVVNVNHEADSVTLFEVRRNGRRLRKAVEIEVGHEPHCVAVRPAGGDIFVTNGSDSTVSVISQNTRRVVRTIAVGTEPRGCALTPNGQRLYVANHTAGTVSVIDTGNRSVIDTVDVGGNPFAIAITDRPGSNERVYVTDFYARLIQGGPGEGFDDGKQGIVRSFTVNNPNNVVTTTLAPLLDSGFTANRARFCTGTTVPPNLPPVEETFCPNTSITDPTNDIIDQVPQSVFPNQLFSALIRGTRLFLPNIGAQPEPPVNFRTNVQALVHVVNTGTNQENAAEHVNLNDDIDTEPAPTSPTTSLGKLFGNDIVAIDATPNGSAFFIVSRGGNYVLRASLQGGRLRIGAPDNVVRFKTGNIPTGIAVRGRFAYVNNEVGHSVSILDLNSNGNTVALNVPSSEPPKPGSHEHAVLLGKLVFFTALGVPDSLVGRGIRDIDPLADRGKQSSDAWSSCGSCHPAGLSDSVTWIFADGPRNTLPLDALYSKINGPHDTRINNFSAVRDSVTDFNNNSRAVQCGTGFAGGATNTAIGCPPLGTGAPNPAVYDHGISQGASEALDFETEWAETVRPLNVPQPADSTVVNAGRSVFVARCASCHGGAKWTKSQVFYLNNPALTRVFATGDEPRDPLLTVTANQVVSYFGGGAPPNGVDTGTLRFLEGIGTFDPSGAIEIRGAGGAIGQRALGADGFNVPSLLSTSFHAPYFHNGAAQTLERVFDLHQLPGGGTIQALAGASDLLAFLRSIDGRTAIEESDGDIFKDPTRNLTP